MFLAHQKGASGYRAFRTATGLVTSIFFVIAAFSLLAAEVCQAKGGFGFCSQTAKAAFKACRHEIQDDYWIAVGNCNSLSDPEDRAECLDEAGEEFTEAREECKDQREARLEICDELGEDPYDPMIDPEGFVDFEEVLGGGAFTPNRYFPLEPGTTWDYEARDAGNELLEKIKVEVLDETKEILGVNCIVVRDRVWEIDEGEEVLIEDTDDWYAQDLAGNVWYFGEIAQEFEDGELVSLEGSWKAGSEHAKAGYLMMSDPQEGDYYRQEFALGDAEDMGEVISRDEKTVTVPFGGPYDDDVVETEDFTPIEPDVFEYKYYAPNVGLVLETDPETGDRVELVNKTTTP